MRSKLKNIDPSLWAALATLILFSLPLLQNLRYIGRDATLMDIPFLCELKNLALEGRNFLLSPRIGNGEPLFANIQSQVLYPFRWIFLSFDPVLQKSLGVIIHLSMAAFAMSFLLSKFGVRRTLCFFGGLSFALSGTVLDLINHGPYLIAAVWIPLAWAATRDILASQSLRKRDFFLLLLPLVFLLIGGEPQSFFLLVGICAAEWLLQKEKRRETGLALLLAPLLAVALSAPLLFAAFAELKLSERSTNMNLQSILQWSLDFPSTLAALWPGILTEHNRQGVNVWATLTNAIDRQNGMPWNENPYLSFSVIACALAGFREKIARSALGIAILALVLSMGSHLWGAAALIKMIPILGSFRYPIKLLLLASIAIWVLAFVGLDLGLREDPASPRRRTLLISLCVCAAIQILVQFFLWHFRDFIDAVGFKLQGEVATDPNTPLLSEMLFLQAMHSTGVLALMLICLSLNYFRKWRIANLLPWILVFDLGLAGFAGISLDYSLLDRPSPLARALPPTALLCHDFNFLGHDIAVTMKTSTGTTTLYTSNILYKLVDFPNLSACDGISSAVRYSMFEQYPSDVLKSLIRTGTLPASLALGCTHLVTNDAPIAKETMGVRPLAVHGLSDLVGGDESRSPKLFQLLDPIPSVFLATQPELFRDTNSMLVHLINSKNTQEIENAIDNPKKNLPIGFSFPAQMTGKISKLKWTEPSQATIELQGSGPALLGLRTAYAAGWEATQSGHVLPVVRIAGNLLGAYAADASMGPIVFEYKLPGFMLGIILSGLALFGIVFWVVKTIW